MAGMISVIVPVYNVSAYLAQCLDSILAQDYRDLEIILIDDGSTDDSGEICRAYAAGDSRIRVIHQENRGGAAAKNTGLRAATGEYLSFVDSDDSLQPGVYSYMVELLQSYGADAVQCSFQKQYLNAAVPMPDSGERKLCTAEEFLPLYLTGYSYALLWNKLYRRELFRDIYFPEGRLIDDEFFTYRGMMNAGKILLDNRIIYNYRIRRSSVMHRPQSENRKLMDRIAYLTARRLEVGERFPGLKPRFDREYLYDLMNLSRNPYHTEQSLLELREQLRTYFRTKGNTMPRLHHWPKLLRLLLGSPRTLLKLREKPGSAAPEYELYP